MSYEIHFDFDGGVRDEQGNYVPDPPHVFITDETGCVLLEVFEDATPKEDPPNSDTEWIAGDLAQKLLRLLNETET